MFERLLRLLFPEKCVLCRGILSRDELDLCRTCRQKAPIFGKTGKNIRFVADHTAVWYYEDPVRGSLLRYKFHGAMSYHQAYGRMMAMRALRDLPGDLDVVTWVPIGPRRKARRGYDQVELLAKIVSQELELPMERLLVKRRDNRAQSGIESAQERRANVLGVYEIVDVEKLRGRKVLLLDDIITTGATVSECARMLLTGGAEKVYCAAVAAGRNHK